MTFVDLNNNQVAMRTDFTFSRFTKTALFQAVRFGENAFSRTGLKSVRAGCSLLFFTFILFSQQIDAQTFAVMGTVLSGEDNQPLIGVSVQEKSTGKGITTDVDGKFRLEV